ncbi:hypothetical protein RCL_jg769.t1 [Rhizophagus clarus]|uniref:Uncharacterized protein n=1 Tax=Rhizophagus clarus TaxID=94130 RepID=A0A8H3L917_9GLOM|nr:hypothetical protein RCL_jg769.t1 [Rhizophagus clarus]
MDTSQRNYPTFINNQTSCLPQWNRNERPLMEMHRNITFVLTHLIYYKYELKTFILKNCTQGNIFLEQELRTNKIFEWTYNNNYLNQQDNAMVLQTQHAYKTTHLENTQRTLQRMETLTQHQQDFPQETNIAPINIKTHNQHDIN